MDKVEKTKPQAKKVLLIGWDAADWRAMRPLMEQGLMPTLSNLVAGGASGNLTTLDPPLSPMLWTSIATGMTADRHGILGFVQPNPDQQSLRPVLGSARRVKAIWNMLMQTGLRTHVIGWWPSHPAEPVNGVFVSNFYHRAGAPLDQPWPLAKGAIHPSHLSETLAELRVHPQELTFAHIQPFVPNLPKLDPAKEKRLSSVAKIIADCASVHAAATWAMENEPWDFMTVYYDAIDHFGHGFMKFHPPQRPGIPDELYENYHQVVTAGYRFHDMMLERLLQLAGPDTLVMLISDHGFHPDHLRPTGIPKEPAGPAVEHRDLGILVINGPGIVPNQPIHGAGLLDIAPTILTAFGLPIGQDMPGRPLVEAFEETIKPHTISSWETVEGECGMHPPEDRADPWAEREMVTQLAALGYIELPDETGSDSENSRSRIEKLGREAQFYLARVYLSTGRPAEAVAILEELVDADSTALRFRQRLAQGYQNLGRLADCRRVVEGLLADKTAAGPSLDVIHGALLLAEKRAAEALTCLERARAAGYNGPGLFQRLGFAYLQEHDFLKAEQAFRQVLEIDSERAPAAHGLAVACLRQNQLEEAIDAGLLAVSLQFQQPAAHFHLGEALFQAGQIHEAAQAYQIAARQAPRMKKAHARLAEIYGRHLWRPRLSRRHRKIAAALGG